MTGCTWKSARTRGAGAVGAVVVGILVAASPAMGQAAVDQYIPNPDPGGGDPTELEAAAPRGGPATAATAGGQDPGGQDRKPEATQVSDQGGGSSGGIELPGGYPVPPIAALIGVLLAVALAVRVVLYLIERREGPSRVG